MELTTNFLHAAFNLVQLVQRLTVLGEAMEVAILVHLKFVEKEPGRQLSHALQQVAQIQLRQLLELTRSV